MPTLSVAVASPISTGVPFASPVSAGVPLAPPVSTSVLGTAVSSPLSASVLQGLSASMYCPAVSAHLPFTTGSLVSSSHQSGGQLNVNINSAASSKDSPKPFVLKFKTKNIRICQSCRKNYEGSNDTLGMVVARAERRLVSNLSTGVQFLGKESNSHYNANKFVF